MEYHDRISEKELNEVLNEHKGLIELWLGWSADKRVNKGWYFLLNDEDKPVVGYYPDDNDLENSNYLNITEACAKLIKEEIEETRKRIIHLGL